MSSEKEKQNQEDESDAFNDSFGNEFPPQSPRKGQQTLDSSGEAEALKKMKRDCNTPEERSPGTSPRPIVVAASPPKFVSMDQILKAANGVTNMALAHEIAVDSDFHFEKLEEGNNSIEKQMKEVMHRAFWDSLQEKLSRDPPDYSHALVLMQEIKGALFDLLLPHHKNMRTAINEVFDMDLIQQKVENDAFDMFYYAEFIISLMAKLCAPARDERVANIKNFKEPVPLFREIFAVLDLMKMDMANFTIQQIRPYIQQQSVDYEKQKFQEILKAQQESNLDGLQFTREWLTRSVECLESQSASQGAQSGACSGVSPASVINKAYMELLEWDDDRAFPETLLMDEGRFLLLREQVKRLTLISAVLLVTYNTVGASIAGIRDLKDKLKHQVSVLLADVSDSGVGRVMPNVAEQINQEVNKSLVDHGFQVPPSDKQSLLKQQIIEVAQKDHNVVKIVRNRILDFILSLLTSTKAGDQKIPAGLSAVSEELSQICGRFLRLVSHNKSVYSMYYSDIIGALLKRHDIQTTS